MNLPEQFKLLPGDEPTSVMKKLTNIECFRNIDRCGLIHNTNERRILLNKTKYDEEVFIQYPGKESIEKEMHRYDFRPKIKSPRIKIYHDLAFNDVYNDMKRIYFKDRTQLPILATIFAHMAFMTFHKKVIEHRGTFNFDPNNGAMFEIKETELSFYKFSPPTKLLDELQETIGFIGDYSVEGYLLLNEYIAQNEDCKYNDIARESKIQLESDIYEII